MVRMSTSVPTWYSLDSGLLASRGAPRGNGFYRHSLLAMQGENLEMGKVDQDCLEKMYWPKADNMLRQSHTFDWHTDSSFEANSPDYTILKMAELPATGGGRSNTSLLTGLQRVNIAYHRYPLGLRLRTLRPPHGALRALLRVPYRHLQVRRALRLRGEEPRDHGLRPTRRS